MSDHDLIRETLALDLYGEADAGDVRLAEEHLHECADCRAFRAALRSGLGVLAPPPLPSDPDLPALLEARLRQDARIASRPRRLVWIASAGSFAAGILLTLALRTVPSLDGERLSGAAPPSGPSATTPSAPDFTRATPPPRSTSRGLFGQLRLSRSG